MGTIYEALIEALKQFWKSIEQSFNWAFSEKINMIIHDTLNGTLKNIDFKIKDSLNMFTEIELLPKLLAFVTSVGMILIITKSIWEILQLYIFRTEGQLPQTNVPTFLSRIVIAIIFTFLSPFVATLSFQLGTATSSELIQYVFTEDIQELYSKELLLDMDDYGIKFKTACWYEGNQDVEPNETGVSPNGYFEDTRQLGVTYKLPINTLYPANHELNTGEKMTMLYKRYCRPVNADLNKPISDDVNISVPRYPNTIFDTVKNNVTFDEAYTATHSSNGLISTITIIGLIIFPIIFLIQMAVRVAELGFSIIVSPMFAFSYVNDTKSQAIKIWTQNIVSIALTQAGQTMLFILFVTTYATTGGLLSLGFGLLMIRSPHMIKEWTQASGTGGVASGLGGAVGGVVGKMFRR
ncbi:hypothetical protein KHQ81_15475 (plasmid) [Mycoplasmatota bacterium]|nr:hypothetical protein KHQ81_15475 [Mycoplasmatota bacterium]